MSSTDDTRYDLLCVGNALVDVISHTDDAFLERHGMAKGAMALIEDDAAHEIYAAMGPGVEISGGSAANTAAGVASFGGRAAFIGKVADDQLGEVFAHDIRAVGVAFDPVPADSSNGVGTGRCLVLVTSDAQRTLNTYLGVASQISPDDIDPELVASSAVVYCEGYLWDQPNAKAAIAHAMDLAREAGRKVAFTLSDAFCVDRHREEFLDLAEGRVDVLFANEVELCSLYETEDFDEALEALAGKVEIACLTRSEKGSVIVTSGGERIEVQAAPVSTVVDTTGAGDLYAAGFLHGLATGADLAECGRLASLAAAEVISHVGARPETPLAELART